MSTKHLHPLIVQQTFHRCRRHDIFKEQRCKDGCKKALQRLQNRGSEPVEGVGRIACRVQKGRIDVRVEKGDDGEKDGEDGYDRADGEGQMSAVEMNDAVEGIV